MPWLGLILCSTWFFVIFVLRSLIHWLRTSSMGLNGIGGRVGSLEWLSGACAVLGLVLAPFAPAAILAGWPLSSLYFNQSTIHIVGAVVSITGIGGGFLAQLAMGDAWRIGVGIGERTTLVTHGMYGWVRNPIFTFIEISLVGFFFTVPNTWSAITLILMTISIQLQVRLVEEPYLHAIHGDTYKNYTAIVGRFIPNIGYGDVFKGRMGRY